MIQIYEYVGYDYVPINSDFYYLLISMQIINHNHWRMSLKKTATLNIAQIVKGKFGIIKIE